MHEPATATNAGRSTTESRKSLASQCRRARTAVHQARDAGVEPPNWATTSNIHIGVPGRPGAVAVIPAASVIHAPRGRHVSICPTHVRAAELGLDQATAHCPRGAKCAFVHCDAPHVALYTPHIAHDWRAPLAGDGHVIRRSAAAPPPPPPERFPFTGRSVPLARPNEGGAPTGLLPTEALYVTRVFDQLPGGIAGLPYAPWFVAHECAHFRNRRRCDRGADCAFAHVAVIPQPTTTNTAPNGLSRASLPAATRRPAPPHQSPGAVEVPATDDADPDCRPRDPSDAGPDRSECRRHINPAGHRRRSPPYQHRPYSATPRSAEAPPRRAAQ